MRVARSYWDDPARKGMQREGAPARILDLLETDRGWLTVAGIAHALDLAEYLVARSLWRLSVRGLVERRRVGLAAVHGAGHTESREEWRARP